MAVRGALSYGSIERPKELQASLERILGQAGQSSEAVEKEVARIRRGLRLTSCMRRCARTSRAPYVTFLITNQFPVFSTFMKLTLLNHLLLYNFPSRKEPQGYIRFLPLVRE